MWNINKVKNVTFLTCHMYKAKPMWRHQLVLVHTCMHVWWELQLLLIPFLACSLRRLMQCATSYSTLLLCLPSLCYAYLCPRVCKYISTREHLHIHQRQRLAHRNYSFTLLLRFVEIIGSHNCRLAMASWWVNKLMSNDLSASNCYCIEYDFFKA